MAQVAQAEGAQRIGGREIVNLLPDVPVVAVPAQRRVVLGDRRVGRDVAVEEVEGIGAEQVGHRGRKIGQVGENRFAEVDVGAGGPGVRLLRHHQQDEPHAQQREREAGKAHQRLGTSIRRTRPSMPLPPPQRVRSAAATSSAPCLRPRRGPRRRASPDPRASPRSGPPRGPSCVERGARSGRRRRSRAAPGPSLPGPARSGCAPP